MRNSFGTTAILISFICLFIVVAGMYLVSAQREDERALVVATEQPVAVVAPRPEQPDPAEQGKIPDEIPLPESETPSFETFLSAKLLAPVSVPGTEEVSEEEKILVPLPSAVEQVPVAEEEAFSAQKDTQVESAPGEAMDEQQAEVSVPPVAVKSEEPKRQVISGVVTKGDSAARILAPYISGESVQQLLSATRKVHPLTQIHVGQPYTLVRAPQGKAMERFEYEVDDNRRLVVKRTESGFQARLEPIEYDCKLVKVSGTIRSSLFQSLSSAGESPILAVSIAEIFGSEINFIKDLREGDTFSLLIEKRYRDHTFRNYGKILGATFTNQGKTYEGYLFAAEDGMETYYNATGESLKKTLLKAPLAFTRISSGYSMNRKHPVFFDRRPHQGVDYAAPSGTPVKAVGEGIIETSGWGKGFGNMVVLRHTGGLESMYAHLSGFARGQKKGQRVKQGQVIGYVGATGIATGPHLDFRLKQNGNYVNPTKVVNPRGGSVPRKVRSAFNRQKDKVRSYMTGARDLASYAGK